MCLMSVKKEGFILLMLSSSSFETFSYSRMLSFVYFFFPTDIWKRFKSSSHIALNPGMVLKALWPLSSATPSKRLGKATRLGSTKFTDKSRLNVSLFRWWETSCKEAFWVKILKRVMIQEARRESSEEGGFSIVVQFRLSLLVLFTKDLYEH